VAPRAGDHPSGPRAQQWPARHVINYHHVIHALRRKPQALWSSIDRDSLFPRTNMLKRGGIAARSARRTLPPDVESAVSLPMNRPVAETGAICWQQDLEQPGAGAQAPVCSWCKATALRGNVAVAAIPRWTQLRCSCV